MTGRLSMLQKVIPPDVLFVSFTVDPDRDDFDALRHYARQFEADPARWRFARAEKGNSTGSLTKVSIAGDGRPRRALGLSGDGTAPNLFWWTVKDGFAVTLVGRGRRGRSHQRRHRPIAEVPVKRLRALVIVLGSAVLFTLGLGWLFNAYPMMPLAASREAVRVDRAFNGLCGFPSPSTRWSCRPHLRVVCVQSQPTKTRGRQLRTQQGPLGREPLAGRQFLC